jgi:hypothetical protein
MRVTLGIGVLVQALAGCGCLLGPDPETSTLFGCIKGAEFSVSRGKEEIDAECIVPEPWVLLGLPARSVGSEELTGLGVLPDLASMLAGEADGRPRWCLARELPTKSVPEGVSQETARSSCTPAESSIDEVVIAPAGRVRLSLRRSQSGTAHLTSLRAQTP